MAARVFKPDSGIEGSEVMIRDGCPKHSSQKKRVLDDESCQVDHTGHPCQASKMSADDLLSQTCENGDAEALVSKGLR